MRGKPGAHGVGPGGLRRTIDEQAGARRFLRQSLRVKSAAGVVVNSVRGAPHQAQLAARRAQRPLARSISHPAAPRRVRLGAMRMRLPWQRLEPAAFEYARPRLGALDALPRRRQIKQVGYTVHRHHATPIRKTYNFNYIPFNNKLKAQNQGRVHSFRRRSS